MTSWAFRERGKEREKVTMFCTKQTCYSVSTPYLRPSLRDSVPLAGHVTIPQP